MATERDPLVRQEEGATESSSSSSLVTRIQETLRLFWYLGAVAFGGPTAHVAILRDHLVRAHDFIDEEVFNELFALGESVVSPW